MEENKEKSKAINKPKNRTYQQIMAELKAKKVKNTKPLQNICDTHEDGA